MTSETGFGLPAVELKRASPLGMNDTRIWLRLTTSPPQVSPETVELLKAAVVAWGLEGETRAFGPESFNMALLRESTPDEVFEHRDTGLSVLQWEVYTNQGFGDRSLRALATWIQRALYVGFIYGRDQRVSATLWVGV